MRIEARLHRAADQAEHLRRQVVALSPQSTLERGYAVVQHRDGRIVMDQDDVGVGELLRVRVARGDFGVRPVSDGTADAPSAAAQARSQATHPTQPKPASIGCPAWLPARLTTPTAAFPDIAGHALRGCPRGAHRHRRQARGGQAPSRTRCSCGVAARPWPRTASAGSTAPRPRSSALRHEADRPRERPRRG